MYGILIGEKRFFVCISGGSKFDKKIAIALSPIEAIDGALVSITLAKRTRKWCVTENRVSQRYVAWSGWIKAWFFWL